MVDYIAMQMTKVNDGKGNTTCNSFIYSLLVYKINYIAVLIVMK